MEKLKSLPADVFEKMSLLGQKARGKVAENKPDEAELLFEEMWELIPNPKSQWGDVENIAVGIGEFFLSIKSNVKALAWIPNLYLLCHSGISPRVYVTEGRIHLMTGNAAKAKELFQKAYDEFGVDAFRSDRKAYLEHVNQKKKKAKVKTEKTKSKEWPVIPDPEAGKLMIGPMQLDEDVHKKIKNLCKQGDGLAEADNYDEAVEKYREALLLIPRPLEKWETSTWIYAAIGDALFLKGDFLAAAEPLRAVMFCPGAVENSFIRLRRGQVAFEKGNLPVAEKEFAEAYKLEGEKIFKDEDPKYLKFLRSS